MPSVAFVSDDFAQIGSLIVPNGCTWYRCVLPGRQLANLGWEMGVGQAAVHDELGLGLAHKDSTGQEQMLTGWDVVVLKLTMQKVVLEAIQRPGQIGNIVVDVDDFHGGLHNDNIAKQVTDPLANPDRNRAWYEQIIRSADFVTVSTEFLADWYQPRVRDVRLVRNAVDCERFPQVDLTDPIIGWVGGTPWRSGDIELLSSWLPEFVKDHGTRVHHSGHIENDPNDFSKRARVETRTTPMTLIDQYPSMFQHFSIGLVPLNMINFNEAKSWIKGLEYAASGIPFIASPTHEYRLLASAGVGRLASTPDEWRDHATELLDPVVRHEEGKRIREIVQENFNISVKGEEWDTALRG